jgi:hypothetical protein
MCKLSSKSYHQRNDTFQDEANAIPKGVIYSDRLCGVVFRVPCYGSRDLSSIPGATRFSEQ